MNGKSFQQKTLKLPLNLGELSYHAAGEGLPVILLHGMAASRYDWDAMLPALAAAGCRAYAPDLPGHGESPKPNDPAFYNMQAMYLALEAWIEGLQVNQPSVLVGHSMGGFLSLRYAQCHPERVRGLVLINPFYSRSQLSPLVRLFNRRPTLGVRAMRLTPEWAIHTVLGWDPISRSKFSPKARRQIALDYKRASPNILHIPATLPDISKELSGLAAPVEVIWGVHDQTLNPRSYPRLVASLPKAQAHPIADCGHQPHIGHASEVNQLVIEFIHSLTETIPAGSKGTSAN